MALTWVGKPQPSIKLNRLIRQKIDKLDRQIYNIVKCDVNVLVTKMLSINLYFLYLPRVKNNNNNIFSNTMFRRSWGGALP